ncbi:MAG TPA: toxin-antitoxin system HicB family antitoxin [Croceibacterium sp.]
MPQSNKKAFALRLDPALYATVERLAAQELRSVNAELEMLLREALARRGIKVPLAEPAKRGRPPKDREDTE